MQIVMPNTVYFQNSPYLFTLEPRLSWFTPNITLLLLVKITDMGSKWALSLANPISRLGSVPPDLFKAFQS
jgi:hypothetical protein